MAITMKDILRDMLTDRKKGINCGIASFCTANELAIEACMQQAQKKGEPVLIEATANQVNQFGGYTGMKPADFRDFVYEIADKTGYPRENIILGGDHLGPLTWSSETEESAMEKSKELVRLFVLAGFKKIHLDTSMRLAEDAKDKPLADEAIARRGVILYGVCEEAYQELLRQNKEELRPVYIIGSEVPIPGGAQEKEDSVSVTKPEALQKTAAVYREEFKKAGKEEGFSHVIGVVVQPGVEFGDAECFRYNRLKAEKLTKTAREMEGIVLEGHSTDYQPKEALREMVEDGIAILKVGPALTFALREGLFALDSMEQELIEEEKRAGFVKTLEKVMLEKPENWKKYYPGNENEQRMKRKYSYSDRIRYYLTEPEVKAAMEQLFGNMDSAELPLSLLHQYMPLQSSKVQNGTLLIDARELVKDCVAAVIADYQYAVRQ